MPRLATSSRVDPRRVKRGLVSSERKAPFGATGLASTGLMPEGCGLTIPRLDGVPPVHQLWQGEQAAARLAHSFVAADIAHVEDWTTANHNPFQFLKTALEGWLNGHAATAIREHFSLDVLITTSLDQDLVGDAQLNDVSKVFLTVAPDSAGYVILGPSLRLLESIHPRLPATFLYLFLGALNRWVRVYDYRDALDRVERLREWYDSDPECDEVALPDIEGYLPKAAKRKPLSRRTLAVMRGEIKDPLARQLMELAIELDCVSCRNKRPEMDSETSDLLIDCGEPVPALLAVFERSDPVEGCFDEDCQSMLEVTPSPNFILPFSGETGDGVVGALAVLGTVCQTLSVASSLMTIMPGNDRLH